MIYTAGVKEQDIFGVGVIIEPTSRGDYIANSAFSVSMAIRITYNNLTESLDADAAVIATRKISEAMENGSRLIKMAFKPTPEQLETIKLQVARK